MSTEVEKALERKIQILENHIKDQEKILENRAIDIEIRDRKIKDADQILNYQQRSLEKMSQTIKELEQQLKRSEIIGFAQDQSLQELAKLIKNSIDGEREQRIRDESDRYDDLHRDQRDEERAFERSLEELEDLS